MSKCDGDISAFWRWFANERTRLIAIRDANSAEWDVALAKLKQIHEGLWFEMSAAEDRPRDFVVTAEGTSTLFPLVEQIVAAAPVLADWRFLALKPAMGFGFETEYENLVFKPQEMWFLPLDNPQDPAALGLRIGITALASSDSKRATAATLMMLDTGLGERAATEDVHHVEVATLPLDPEKEGYIELPELPQFIKWRKGRNAKS